jgi:transposase
VWIAQLLDHGLLRGSFAPPAPIRELRDLTRHRKVMIQERQRAVNRVHKLLQDVGIKLASVATDILGQSGRAMLAALAQGTTDPAVLADLARGRLRAKRPALRGALAGRFRLHHAFLVSQLLAHIDYLDEAIATVSGEVDRVLAPFAAQVAQVDTIPGINKRTAEVLIAEIVADMSRFRSEHHLASWAGLCPGNNESAGKHKAGMTRKGSVAPRRASRGGPRRDPDEGQRARRALPARHASPRAQEGGRRGRACDAPGRLSCPGRGDDLSGSRAGLLRSPPGRHATRRAVELLERQGYRVTLEPA